VSPPGKLKKTKIAVGEIWCILGQRMITYDSEDTYDTYERCPRVAVQSTQ